MFMGDHRRLVNLGAARSISAICAICSPRYGRNTSSRHGTDENRDQIIDRAYLTVL